VYKGPYPGEQIGNPGRILFHVKEMKKWKRRRINEEAKRFESPKGK